MNAQASMLASRSSRDTLVTEVAGRAAFMALEAEWNALVSATGAGPFQRHDFIRIWIDSFAPEARLLILTGRDGGGRLVAALPLLETRGFICGMPVRQLLAPANAHSCRFDMIAAEPGRAARGMLAYLLAREGWDVVRISDVPEGGRAWQILRVAQESGLPVGAWPSQRSPYIDLPLSYEALAGSLRPHFRSNLRRRRRRLEALGAVSLEHVSDGAHLQERLAEGFALEHRGWKGERGTAIVQDAQTLRFYDALARSAADRGHLSLFFLRLDGRAVAFQYGLTCGGTYSVLKMAYDESLSACDPGHLSVEDTIKYCIARGLRRWDFLGADAPWKQEWNPALRAHHWLFIFRDSRLGRAARRAKFEFLPLVRGTLAALTRTGMGAP
jgi:CelD/BcsL family acetyltransferase involved in cellulose biosynthesis